VNPPPTIAVIGGDPAGRAQMARILAGCGFSRVLSADSLSGLRELALAPDLIILTVQADARAFLTEAREASLWVEVPILAIAPSVPPSADGSLLAAGADEVVRDPPSPAVLGARVRGLLRRQDTARQLREMLRVNSAMREIQSLVSQGGDAPEVLRRVLMIAVGVLGFERGTLIAHVESSDRAYVIAATDDPTLQQFCLMVSSYPEITAALRSGEPVLVSDTQNHPITAGVADALRARQVAALAVFPCFWRRRGLGALLFRKPEPGIEHLTPARINFGVVLAGQVAAQLRDSHIVEHMSEATRRISRASYEAERRLRTIESLKEHFDASADGVVVLDESGHILFVNGAAESITGFARDGLVGSPLADLVPPEQRAPVEEVIRSVLGGTNLEAFDLDLFTTSGEPICVSVTTSTVLAKSSAVILSFRDVTAERALENELQQTKDFLERIIDSAVDAIVAADMQGRVVLFNPGAERLFGHDADEVVGRLSVKQLYPPGVAQRIMRALRSDEEGGKGRLGQSRVDVVTRAGHLVPVNMTASILYENDKEAATVGILSDLRERLKMEDQLMEARLQQEGQLMEARVRELEMEQQQAIVALAGAAAHELNQPLTSIMGYAQLVQRQSDPDASHLRALNIILRESSRMADIVRQIGRITRYETKQYVGSASIMDLERSAPAHSGRQPPSQDPESEPGEVTQVVDEDRTPSLEDVVLADMAHMGDLPDVIDIPEIADMAAIVEDVPVEGPTGLDALIEPVEEEITAQHVIGSRRAATRADTSEVAPLERSLDTEDEDNEGDVTREGDDEDEGEPGERNGDRGRAERDRGPDAKQTGGRIGAAGAAGAAGAGTTRKSGDPSS
jgi:PAS domain S-box-containing protein